jgi:hypothetical protein
MRFSMVLTARTDDNPDIAESVSLSKLLTSDNMASYLLGSNSKAVNRKLLEIVFLQSINKVGAGDYISHEHDRCLIIKPIMDSLAEVTEIDIDGRIFWARPVGSWVLESGNVVAEAMAVSLDKPLEWAAGFFFGKTELSIELWTVISGISGFDD